MKDLCNGGVHVVTEQSSLIRDMTVEGLISQFHDHVQLQHSIFHQKYVYLLSNPFPSKALIVSSPHKSFYSQPIYSSW